MFAIQCAMHTLRIKRNTINVEVDAMFKIKDDKIETENKTIRFPLPLINKIEEAIRGKNVTFSKFVIQACEYALENMNDKSKDNEK